MIFLLKINYTYKSGKFEKFISKLFNIISFIDSNYVSIYEIL